jgi:two-component system, NarL family, response regulator YdfI
VIRVLVAADNLIVRTGLESILRANPALEVVGSSSDVATLVQNIEALHPDVVLLEWLETDDDSVLEKLSALGIKPGIPAIVVLTDEEQNDGVALALRSGVRGVLSRRAAASEILAAVEAVAAGVVVLHPDVVNGLLSLLPLKESPEPSLTSSVLQSLTPREIEVLGMLALGLGNKTIAKQLGISEHTVKFHVSSIFTKLNASTRTEAVAVGARLGLIML